MVCQVFSRRKAAFPTHEAHRAHRVSGGSKPGFEGMAPALASRPGLCRDSRS